MLPKSKSLRRFVFFAVSVQAIGFGVRSAPGQNPIEPMIAPARQLALQSQQTALTHRVAVLPEEHSSASHGPPHFDIDRVLTALVLNNIPHQYTDDRKWGMQEERWDGVDIRRDGWQIRTKRKKKMVNHGTWQKYSAQLINPDQGFSVNVSEFSQLPNGALGFDLNFIAPLALHGRQAQWIKGVQYYSISAEGRALVRLSLRCELMVDLVFRDWAPEIEFSPVITRANLHIDEFEIDRVSKLGGEFAQQVTRATRSALETKISAHETKLIEKINRQIENKKGSLTIALSDAIGSKWTENALPHLPQHIQAAIRAEK